MARCARSVEFTSYPADGTSPGSQVRIPADAVSFTLRAVSAAGVGVAWTLGLDTAPSPLFHFAAGEAHSPGGLKLDGDLSLRVIAVAGSLVELIAWLA